MFSAEEVERVANGIDERYKSLVHVLAYGGLRWGEAAGLTRSAVELQRGRLEVRRSVADAGGRLYVGETKDVPTTLRRAADVPAG